MPKLLECDRCLLYARNLHLVCAVHPAGLNTETCLDFREDPNVAAQELWEPEGASYYNGELILQPKPLWTRLATVRCWTRTHCLLVDVLNASSRSPTTKRPRCIGIVRLADGSMIRFEAMVQSG